MAGGHAPLLLLMLLAGLLLAAGLEDVRSREIANRKNAAIALLAPLWWWANHLSLWPDIALQVAMATAVFALFAGAFAAGWMGGGDVKMIGALALWLPVGSLLQMLMTMSVVGGGVTLAMLIETRLRRGGGPGEPLPIEVPYGVAIAIAGLLALPRTGF
ncbi:A24 family peptidase [Sphingomonas bacterium]|uniref:A24 family peptidase n=1 Tax=Sphingomonas bacterium TaxID=1895847 RepID=UPI0015755795|nr:prepilin peptidase [Sphingomonas bacterium]